MRFCKGESQLSCELRHMSFLFTEGKASVFDSFSLGLLNLLLFVILLFELHHQFLSVFSLFFHLFGCPVYYAFSYEDKDHKE